MRKLTALILIFGGLTFGAYNVLHRLDRIGPKPGLIRKLSVISRFKEQRREEVFIVGSAILTLAGLSMAGGRKRDKGKEHGK